MNKKNVYQILLAAMVWGFLSGCSPLQKEFRAKNYFSLAVPPLEFASMESPGSQNPETQPKGLLVRELSISPEFATSFFVYQISPVQYREDYYNQFMVPPARMITDLLRENLYGSGLFRPIPAGEPFTIDFRLSGKIVDLYVDMKDSAHPYCVLSMRLILDKKEEKSNQEQGFTQVMSRFYKARVPAFSNAPKVIALGFSECGKQIISTFYEDLKHLQLFVSRLP